MAVETLDPYSGDVGPWDDDDCFDIPEADPAIRRDYEAALGRLILAHNNIDRYVTLLIQSALARLGNPPEQKGLTTGSFMKRLDALQKLSKNDALELNMINFDEIRDLNESRNILAHGHFEQDQFSGEYELITNRDTHADFSAERINSLTGRMLHQAKHLEAIHDFYNVALGSLAANPGPTPSVTTSAATSGETGSKSCSAG